MVLKKKVAIINWEWGRSRPLEKGRKCPGISQSYQASIQSACQRNNISMVFCWQANDGPLIVVLGSSLPISTPQKNVKVGPPLTNLSGSAHVYKNMMETKKRVEVDILAS